MAAENQCDRIFVQTDATFVFVLDKLKELKKLERLQVQHVQVASIENIESNAEKNENCFVFGGGTAGQEVKILQSFARTASSVFRMCMLQSANVPKDCWPNFGPQSRKRNENKMRYDLIFGPGHNFEFTLTQDKSVARAYYSSYDHIHPHFKLEHQLSHQLSHQLQPFQQPPWWHMQPTRMVIFRGNFSEVIEFNTSFVARYRPDISTGTYQSYVNVQCTVSRFIIDIKSQPHLKTLNECPDISSHVCDILSKDEAERKLPNYDQIKDPVVELPYQPPVFPFAGPSNSVTSLADSLHSLSVKETKYN